MSQKKAGIYLRKGKTKDTWMLDFTFRDIRYRVKLGSGISESVANEQAFLKRAEIMRDESGIGGQKKADILFDQAAAEFLKWAETNKRPGTLEFYRYGVQGLGRTFKGMKLSQISPFTVERHKAMRKAEGYAVQANSELATLSGIFNKCIEWGKYEGPNPAAQKKVKRFDVGLTKHRFLSENEEERLLAECGEPLRSVVLIGIYSGLRIKSEVLTLKPGHIDLAHRLIIIEGAYAKNKQTRPLPMHSKLVEIFKRLLGEVKGEFLFAHPDRERLQNIRHAFDLACQRARLKGVTPHTLRHTFASRLAMADVGSVTLQELGRWESPEMVRRYAHLSPKHLAQAIERIGDSSRVTGASHGTFGTFSKTS